MITPFLDGLKTQNPLPNGLLDDNYGNFGTHDHLNDFSGMSGRDTPKDLIESKVRGTQSGTQHLSTGDLREDSRKPLLRSICRLSEDDQYRFSTRCEKNGRVVNIAKESLTEKYVAFPTADDKKDQLPGGESGRDDDGGSLEGYLKKAMHTKQIRRW